VNFLAAAAAIEEWQILPEGDPLNCPSLDLAVDFACDGEVESRHDADGIVLALQARLYDLLVVRTATSLEEDALWTLRTLLHADLARLRAWIASHPEGTFNYDYQAQGACTRTSDGVILWVEVDIGDTICPIDCEYYTLKRLSQTGVLAKIEGLRVNHWLSGELVEGSVLSEMNSAEGEGPADPDTT
jgi:hypothetical protein